MVRVVRAGADFDEESFQAWYGPVRGLTPREVADLFVGSGIRWAVAGGRAARVGAKQSRHHEDTDVEVPATQLGRLREHLAEWHLWQVDDGGLRPLLADDELRPGVHQLWLRRDSSQPWVLDVLLVPGDGEEWVYRRDEDVRLPWSRAHWVVGDATYVRPEIALLFKAKHDQSKDRSDLAAARLTEDGRAWLVERLRAEGRHEWAELATHETRWRDLRL
jgi:hypothetical protein